MALVVERRRQEQGVRGREEERGKTQGGKGRTDGKEEGEMTKDAK